LHAGAPGAHADAGESRCAAGSGPRARGRAGAALEELDVLCKAILSAMRRDFEDCSGADLLKRGLH